MTTIVRNKHKVKVKEKYSNIQRTRITRSKDKVKEKYKNKDADEKYSKKYR